jgi:acyl-CoA dehydrogenase
MARAALAASKNDAAGDDQDFQRTKLATARFYAEKILPKAHALRETILRGASGAIDIPIEQF